MSFSIPHPPSASSDSGSSASLTPTAAHGYTSNTGFSDPSSSTASAAAPASGSLFSSEESKFITDSLSSAESFDPFTLGAPGFKVPSLLPPNIAATHDHLVSQVPSTSAPLAGVVPDATSSTDMRSRSLSGQPSYALGYSTSSPGGQGADAYGNTGAASRLNSFNLYGHRPTGATPPAGQNDTSSPSYFSHLHGSFPYTHPAGRHASFSGASNLPLSPSAAAGYGKNKAWQLEQLSFLEAQASRGQQQQQQQQQQYASALPHHVGVHNDPHRRSSTSMIGRPSPYENLLFGTPAHLQQQQQQQQQLMDQQQQQQQQQQHHQYRPPFYPGVEEHQTGLAMLGAQFPSSHNFGSLHQGAPPPQQQQQLQQGPARGTNGLPGGFSAQALAMLNGDAGLGAISSLVASEAEAGGASTPKGRTSRTPTANETSSVKKAAFATGAASSASPSGSALGTKRMSTGAPKTAPTQGSSLNSGPSGAVIRALGDLANLDLDLETALRTLPPHLHPYFTPPRLEKRTQPHLEILRQQHIENGLIDPSTGLEIKPEPTEEDLKREAEEAEREKKPNTLLTTEEKKANHIASEQKRRANIRKGYELLCDIVPSLREALEREATSKKRDDEDDSGSDSEKRKKKGSSPSKKDDGGGGGGGGGGIEIDGEKIDGRAGPRSEAVVLMKSLDHIGALVEQYKGLLGRRNRARVAVAKKFGWEGLPNQPVPDVDRLMAIKVQEWWASHEDGEEEQEDDEERLGPAEDVEAEEEGDAEQEVTPVAADESKGKKKSPTKPKKAATPRKKKAAAKTQDDDDGMHD